MPITENHPLLESDQNQAECREPHLSFQVRTRVRRTTATQELIQEGVKLQLTRLLTSKSSHKRKLEFLDSIQQSRIAEQKRALNFIH